MSDRRRYDDDYKKDYEVEGDVAHIAFKDRFARFALQSICQRKSRRRRFPAPDCAIFDSASAKDRAS